MDTTSRFINLGDVQRLSLVSKAAFPARFWRIIEKPCSPQPHAELAEVLGVDSPFVSTIVMLKNQLFPGKERGKLPLEKCQEVSGSSAELVSCNGNL